MLYVAGTDWTRRGLLVRLVAVVPDLDPSSNVDPVEHVRDERVPSSKQPALHVDPSDA
jgi:hypothetical protein